VIRERAEAPAHASILDIMRMGIDSGLLGMGVESVQDLRPEHPVVPEGFHRALGAPTQAVIAVRAVSAKS